MMCVHLYSVKFFIDTGFCNLHKKLVFLKHFSGGFFLPLFIQVSDIFLIPNHVTSVMY